MSRDVTRAGPVVDRSGVALGLSPRFKLLAQVCGLVRPPVVLLDLVCQRRVIGSSALLALARDLVEPQLLGLWV